MVAFFRSNIKTSICRINVRLEKQRHGVTKTPPPEGSESTLFEWIRPKGRILRTESGMAALRKWKTSDTRIGVEIPKGAGQGYLALKPRSFPSWVATKIFPAATAMPSLVGGEGNSNSFCTFPSAGEMIHRKPFFRQKRF